MQSRIHGDPDAPSFYHLMSRTVADKREGGMMFFDAFEKNVFAKQMRQIADFSGIEVLTWCMMDNHFHLLVRVPQREALIADVLADGRKLFWTKMLALYDKAEVKEIRDEIEALEKEGQARRAQAMVARFTDRMGDLAHFMQGLKFRFSVWFNRKYQRQGTLWHERFKSVLLEGDTAVLNKVAAYIDLNPIRAGLVTDPGDYHWSGYGQAVGGKKEARRGLSAVYGYDRSEWRQVAARYRALLYLEGIEVRDAEGMIERAGVPEEDYYRELANRGEESLPRRMARQVAYFSRGAAIGGKVFLEQVFERNREKFGPRRKNGARKFRGAIWKGSGMFSLRDLAED